MLALILSMALAAQGDPTADLAALHQTVVDDMAVGKLPAANTTICVLSYVNNAIVSNALGTARGRSRAKSWIISMRFILNFIFSRPSTLTAADKALLISEVNQALIDLGP